MRFGVLCLEVVSANNLTQNTHTHTHTHAHAHTHAHTHTHHQCSMAQHKLKTTTHIQRTSASSTAIRPLLVPIQSSF